MPLGWWNQTPRLPGVWPASETSLTDPSPKRSWEAVQASTGPPSKGMARARGSRSRPSAGVIGDSPPCAAAVARSSSACGRWMGTPGRSSRPPRWSKWPCVAMAPVREAGSTPAARRASAGVATAVKGRAASSRKARWSPFTPANSAARSARAPPSTRKRRSPTLSTTPLSVLGTSVWAAPCATASPFWSVPVANSTQQTPRPPGGGAGSTSERGAGSGIWWAHAKTSRSKRTSERRRIACRLPLALPALEAVHVD